MVVLENVKGFFMLSAKINDALKPKLIILSVILENELEIFKIVISDSPDFYTAKFSYW